MGDYPYELEVDFEPKRSRLTTFFRFLLAIPHVVAIAVVGLVSVFAVIAMWFSQVFAGRSIPGAHRFVLGTVRWSIRLGAYMLLATDRYPPFSLDPGPDFPVRVVGPEEPAPEASRWKALLRYFLAIPWGILNFAYMVVAYLAAIGSWFAILVTGRQPEGLQKAIHMGLASNLQYYSFYALLTDRWPPIEPELRLEPRARGALPSSAPATAPAPVPAAVGPAPAPEAPATTTALPGVPGQDADAGAAFGEEPKRGGGDGGWLPPASR
ncbi:DUF4389 domain-containing protein [Conexibacter sp. SYSU D00693]|uniref:DUF4389 domain-containing protein n=1 Tax=Conexibacter sp. SYSU D00693 TaxID=2812560 RepID=UPI00196B02A1|nr:DUF4389 domain-containing protein [Conexibacter sp. SYSU D00693]